MKLNPFIRISRDVGQFKCFLQKSDNQLLVFSSNCILEHCLYKVLIISFLQFGRKNDFDEYYTVCWHLNL